MANLIQAPAGPPSIPLGLLEWLERKYPLRVYAYEASKTEMFHDQGQYELVAELRHHYNRQNLPQKD